LNFDDDVIESNAGIELHSRAVVASFVLHLETVGSFVEGVEVRADGSRRVSGCVRLLNDHGILFCEWSVSYRSGHGTNAGEVHFE
jgi:hypothetical protein